MEEFLSLNMVADENKTDYRKHNSDDLAASSGAEIQSQPKKPNECAEDIFNDILAQEYEAEGRDNRASVADLQQFCDVTSEIVVEVTGSSDSPLRAACGATA